MQAKQSALVTAQKPALPVVVAHLPGVPDLLVQVLLAPVQIAAVGPAWQPPPSCPLQCFLPFFPVQTPEQHSFARLHRLPTSLQPGPAATG